MNVKELITLLETFSPDLQVDISNCDSTEPLVFIEGNNINGRLELVGKTAAPLGPCQCHDKECPHCGGECQDRATETLYRIDMDDTTGTPLCFFCSEDAMNSGVFSTSEERP